MPTIEELQAQIAQLEATIAQQAEELDRRRQLEEELKESKILYESLVDALELNVFRKDREGRIIFGNKPYLKTLGMTMEEVYGKTNEDFYPKEMADKYTADDRRVIETGEAFEDIESHKAPTGDRVIYVQVKKVPVRDSHGNIIGTQGIFWDVTEQKEREIERQQMQQQIIEAQQRALQELSTPIIPLFDGILVMPLIGSIDTARARDVTRSLLGAVTQHRAKTVIVDITGVAVVDSGVADHLNKTIQAARLKGARTIVTGISEAIAETVVDLGINWNDLDTLPDLQSGLMAALLAQGIRLVRTG